MSIGPPTIVEIPELIAALIVNGPQILLVVRDIKSVYVVVTTKAP